MSQAFLLVVPRDVVDAVVAGRNRITFGGDLLSSSKPGALVSHAECRMKIAWSRDPDAFIVGVSTILVARAFDAFPIMAMTRLARRIPGAMPAEILLLICVPPHAQRADLQKGKLLLALLRSVADGMVPCHA